MLKVTGYADRWSVRQGGTIRFMVSVQGGAPFRARVARVLCGDVNPKGPGYREIAMPCAIEREHRGQEQPIRIGSWVTVPGLDLGGAAAPVGLVATVWPTRLAAGAQAVLSWQGGGVTVTLGLDAQGGFCRVATPGSEVRVATEVPLTERAWHDLACVVDPGAGTVTIGQAPRVLRVDHDERATATAPLPAGAVLAGAGSAAVAAETQDGVARLHFNGKIERPRVLAGAIGVPALLALQASGAAPPTGLVRADWDFCAGIPTDTVADTGPHGWHGRCVNLPWRAATGSRWTGEVHRWTEAPAQYGAIHFHDDDSGDAGWAPSLTLAVPDDWPSGVYALHLESGGARDNIVFYVRAKVAGSTARVAFLAPTFTYQVYSHYAKPGRQAENLERARAWGAIEHQPDAHPEYGHSTYNFHSDGTGIGMASLRRPLTDKRVGHVHLIDPSDDGSGVYWITADSYVTDFLDRKGIPFEVITDHDVHEEGAALLSRYACVLTGQHPEYHTVETLDAIKGFTEGGGRFVYLGGNGFYWKVVPHPKGTWALELRRAEGGIRLWATEPGESYHAFDGTYGGLWRRVGRTPQSLVGIGFSTQGHYKGYPYTFTDGIADPRVAFLREGLGDVARPGAVFGERGLMGGGAAGHELDRVDQRLGTPLHALVVAEAVVRGDEGYQPVNEERLGHLWPGTEEELIRADMTFFETPNGGAVLSVGSMNFIGALPVDGYANTTARLVENLVRRFADPAPFVYPK